MGSITGSKWLETNNFLQKLVSLFLFWEMKAIPCEKLPRKILYNDVYYSIHRTAQTGTNQNIKRSGRPRCTTEHEFEKQTHHNWRRLRDAGRLGRVAKKKPCLRLANKKKRLRWANEHRPWPELNLPRRPASRSPLFTVNVETGVLLLLFNEAASWGLVRLVRSSLFLAILSL